MTDSPTPTRIALVTGAAQGIGEAIALQLAEDGLDVAVADLPQQRERLDAVAEAIRAKGRRSVSLYADVSLEPDVIAMVAQTVEQLGGLDVMIANAGIAVIAPIIDTTVEQWDSTLAVNGRGPFLAIKHAARQMLAQGRGGRIIAASSIAGKRGINLASAYSASKFAVRGLVQAASIELRQHNITVNAYAPGSIMTPLSWHPDDVLNGGHGTTLTKMLSFPPDIKPAPPAVIASLVSHIAKPESFYITGQCINVDGGFVMD
ncbi:NAD-P-binding protein [Trametes meyenii]|nr:NAD-P-binding protein [Trametes meyenii]